MSEPFSVTDFPAEIMERFAPDARASTTSTLRLVCRRFREVFSSDRSYKSYVRYAAAAEPAGDRGRSWKLALEEEKRLLAAWRGGRVARWQTLQLPGGDRASPYSDFYSDYACHGWQDAMDAGEHWFMRKAIPGTTNGKKIVLVNAACDPATATEIDISEFTSEVGFALILFISSRLLIGSGDRGNVFRIEKGESGPSLRHLFAFDRHPDDRYHLCGDLYIGYGRGPVLRIWDLKSGVRLDDLDLARVVPRQAFPDFGRQRSPMLREDVEYPMLIMYFKLEEAAQVEYNVVLNVESRSFVTWFRIVDFSPTICLRGNVMAVYCRTNRYIKLYDIRTLHNDLDESTVLFQDSFGWLMDWKYSDKPPSLVILDEYESAMKITKVVFVMSAEGAEVEETTTTYVRGMTLRSDGIGEWSVVGPFLVAMEKPRTTVARTMRGEQLFEWTKMLKGRGVSFGEYELLHLVTASLSKCVLSSGNQLFIFHF